MIDRLIIDNNSGSGYLSPLPKFDIAQFTMDNADKYTIKVPLPATLSALDLALIVDTLNASTAIVDNGSLFQYSASARRETMQRVAAIMSSVTTQLTME